MSPVKPFKHCLIPLSALLVFLLFGAPATAQAGCNHSGDSVKRISKKNARQAITCLFNKGRSAPNVKRNGDLEQAAQGHSSVMARKRCVSHQCPGEADLKQRVARTGYLNGASGYELGEVIIYGTSGASPRQMVDKWMNSSSHRSTITKSSFDHVGVGLSMEGGMVYATADFGHR